MAKTRSRILNQSSTQEIAEQFGLDPNMNREQMDRTILDRMYQENVDAAKATGMSEKEAKKRASAQRGKAIASLAPVK